MMSNYFKMIQIFVFGILVSKNDTILSKTQHNILMVSDKEQDINMIISEMSNKVITKISILNQKEEFVHVVLPIGLEDRNINFYKIINVIDFVYDYKRILTRHKIDMIVIMYNKFSFYEYYKIVGKYLQLKLLSEKYKTFLIENNFASNSNCCNTKIPGDYGVNLASKMDVQFYENTFSIKYGMMNFLYDKFENVNKKKKSPGILYKLSLNKFDPYVQYHNSFSSVQMLVQNYTDKEVKMACERCVKELINLYMNLDNQNKKSFIEFKKSVFYLMLSVNLSFFDPNVEGFLFKIFPVEYFERICEDLYDWGQALVVHQDLDRFYLMRYLELENEFLLFTDVLNVILQKKFENNKHIDRNFFEKYKEKLDQFHEMSEFRIINTITSHPLGKKIVLDILKQSKDQNSPYYLMGGRFSSLSLTLKNNLNEYAQGE